MARRATTKTVKHRSIALEKKLRFAEEYIVDRNGAKASVRAGFAVGRARQTACELLSDPDVQVEIERLTIEQSKRTEITADRALLEMARLGLSDVRKLFDDNGRLISINQLPDDIAAAVSSIEVVTQRVAGGEPSDVEQVVKVKLWDKNSGLEKLGKHFKMFTEKLELSGNMRVYSEPNDEDA